MEFKVRLFLDGRQIDPADYPKVMISCRDIDMIVNHIYDVNHSTEPEEAEEAEMEETPTMLPGPEMEPLM